MTGAAIPLQSPAGGILGARDRSCTPRACALVLLLPLGAGAGEPDLELGEYLAAECTACHRADAVNAGIPSIFGMPRVLFLQRMASYRDGVLDNPIMRNVAASLGDEDLAALAAYLEQAEPQR